MRERISAEFLVRFGPAEQKWIIEGTELLDDRSLGAFLDRYRSSVEAPDDPTAVSRWSYHMKDTVLYMPLYMLARWNLYIDVSPGQVTFAHFPDVSPAGHRWGMYLPADVHMIQHDDRARIRKQVFDTVLTDHFQPVFRRLSDRTGVGERLLWQNLAHVLYLRYPAWIEDAEDPVVRERFKEDFEVLRSLPSDQYEASDPFRRTFDQMEKTAPSCGEPVRMGCCLNYRLRRYCAECPLVHFSDHGPRALT